MKKARPPPSIENLLNECQSFSMAGLRPRQPFSRNAATGGHKPANMQSAINKIGGNPMATTLRLKTPQERLDQLKEEDRKIGRKITRLQERRNQIMKESSELGKKIFLKEV